MNYIIHLNKAFALFCEDERLTPFHVSLYFGLFQYWNMAKFRNPISISRDELMRASKIGSVNTYIRSIKDLHNWNYIKYIPSYNPQKGSQVYLYTFDNSNNNTNDNSINNGSDISHNKSFDKAGKKAVSKANEKPLIPSINNSNKTNKQNNKNEYGHTRKKNNPKSDLVIAKLFVGKTLPLTEGVSQRDGGGKRKKVAQKKEKSRSVPLSEGVSKGRRRETTRQTRPLLKEVEFYFSANKHAPSEAQKFFAHYQSNGWMVGKVPMKDWKASADKWMLNNNQFTNGKTKNSTSKTITKPSAGKLNATTAKNYSEPL